MKIFYALICFALIGLAASVTSCKKASSFLDNQSTNDLNEEVVFADSARTMQFLNGIYGRLRFQSDPNLVTGTPLSGVCDEGRDKWPGANNFAISIFMGTFNSSYDQINLGAWSYLYTGIRMANIYLADVDKSPLSAAKKAQTKLEARFLRAYFYHFLLRYYGGVMLVGDNVFSLFSPSEEYSRSTYSECVNYITSELDDLSTKLPLTYNTEDYGRVTKGACLALKSRILLTVASPLFNGGAGQLTTKPDLLALVSYPTADPQRWQKAMDAAKAVMDMGKYQLVEDNVTRPGNGFYKMFITRVNSEAILQRMWAPGRIYETTYLPITRNGNHQVYPSQQLVDAFPMKNGKAISEAGSGYLATNPYVNRDPRFEYSIIYNEALWYDTRASVNKETPVYTYSGATTDGLVAASLNSATTTGYYPRKQLQEGLTGNNGTTERCQPLIRYGEILLNYAEAANEMGQTSLAIDQIIALRKRAGIDPGADNRYGIAANILKDDARILIRNERFIELAYEETRFFDIRRWGYENGISYDQQYTKGMKITKTGSTYTYEVFNVGAPNVFKLNAFFFRIPVDEVSVNPKILQNPGW